MPSTVPMLSPNGQTGDIPADRVPDAVKAGFKMGTELTSPDGKLGIVPMERVHDAINAGFMLKPSTINPPASPQGLQASRSSDLSDLVGSAAKSLARVSGPNVLYEALRKAAPHLNLPPALGMPNQNEVMTTGLLSMIPEAEGGVAKVAPEAAAAKVAETASPKVAAVSDLVKRDVLSKVPFAERLGLVKKPTLADYYNAITKSPEAPAAPVPKPPEVPASQANPEQFSFSHRQTGPAIGPAGPVKTSTAEFTQHIKDIIDKAVPPENKGANMEASAKVDFYLKKGNVTAAEKVLDQVASRVNPDWPPAAPQFRGGTNDIRAALKAKTPADLLDDRGIQQEMAQNLERHGQMAEQDAIKEFIARNSTGISKGELTGTLKTAEGDAIRAKLGATAQGETLAASAKVGTGGPTQKPFLPKAKWLADRMNQPK